MYFGVDYYPEHWVWPYAGTKENPFSEWHRDIELMLAAGVNVVRMGEFSWGLCEMEEGVFDFEWLRQAMDLMHKAGIQVVLGTPTAAPPIWLAKKHPDILPIDHDGKRLNEGSRRAACLNNNKYWEACKRIVTEMATALGNHPALIAWQIDNALGAHNTECSFNEETARDWHAWLESKYETIERFNDLTGARHWGQIVTAWDQIPMPRRSPAMINPALIIDWCRFSSDTIVAFVRMQADILHTLSPGRQVTSNLRSFQRRFDHFDVAEALDFVGVDSNVAVSSNTSELACELDLMRCLKKKDIHTPDGDTGFWVIEQKAGQVNWHEVNSLVRPLMLRLFTYQLLSRGASGVLYFRWRQPCIGTEKFYGAVLPHNGRKDSRTYMEVSQLGEEIKLLAPVLKDTTVVADVCILYSYENDWALGLPMQPSKYFDLRTHVQRFYNAFHSKNITVDFARPTEDLSKYKLVLAPSLHLMAGGEADLLKLYVQNGGTLVGTFNTGLVDEHHMAPVNGYPHDLTDVFGLEVLEFDPLPPGEENNMTFKGAFTSNHMHPAKMWCDIIEAKGCSVMATYTKDFYAGKPAVTLNSFGLGKAIYVGTMSHQPFYDDLAGWLKQTCGLQSLLKVPEQVEVCMRQKEGTQIYFLLNHENAPVRINFHTAMHDYLTGTILAGNYELPAHGVLVLDEHAGSAEIPEPSGE